MDDQQIVINSRNCYEQHGHLWRKHAKFHGENFKHKSMFDFFATGIGKSIVLVANGYSFEENLKTLKTYAKKCDIMACDKTLGHLIDNGITPKYCVLADARINYEKYLKPWKDKLQNTILFSNVCANQEWTTGGNWKDVYFHVNKDSINSHIEFQGLSKCPNMIIAGTNVSNAMLILITQCSDQGYKNWFGYDKIILLGYDYCWDQHYYAFDKEGDGKRNYMKNIYTRDTAGNYCYTSANLLFSAQWMQKYISTFRLPVVLGSKRTLLSASACNLKESMKYSYKPEDSQKVIELNRLRNEATKRIQQIDKELDDFEYDHIVAHKATL
jgi:hypothetical protein